jgi:bifunctional non-homologous end joining protein LigD
MVAAPVQRKRRAALSLSEAVKDLPQARPQFVWPMNALLVDKLPTDRNWLYEIKWDGYRAVAVKNTTGAELYSRRSRLITGEFPDVADAVERVPGKSCVLDGEIVALDERGRASFQLMQNFQSGRHAICYYLFDILNYEGHDLTSWPLTRRKEFLAQLLQKASDPVRFSAGLEGEPRQLLQAAEQQGLEGLIGKRPDSRYEPGRRTGAWIKIKVTHEQEFVIGGYTEPQGARAYFGALLVGYYENGKLICAGKVGTGFNEKLLADLFRKFQKLETEQVPFTNLPTRRAGKYGGGITRGEMRRCTWLRPELVAQIKFTEWTQDGGLRHPVFLGLRDDKLAREVVRE